MRLFYFVVTVATVLLCSCSNVDVDSLEDMSNKKYPVSFQIENETLNIEVAPMDYAETKSSGSSLNAYYGMVFLQYIVYNESGEFHSMKIGGGSSWGNIVDKGLAEIKDELAAGKYYIAIAVGICSNPNIPASYYINPKNYFTDYFSPNLSVSTAHSSNINTYYNTFELVVSENSNKDIKIELEPMWNGVTLRMTNFNKIEVPEGAKHVQILINPTIHGFGIADMRAQALSRLPENVVHTFPISPYFTGGMPIEDFLAMDVFESQIISAGTDELIDLELRFLNAEAGQMISVHKLGDFYMKENNKNYIITLDNPIIKKGSVQTGVNITVKEFTGENVNIDLN